MPLRLRFTARAHWTEDNVFADPDTTPSVAVVHPDHIMNGVDPKRSSQSLAERDIAAGCRGSRDERLSDARREWGTGGDVGMCWNAYPTALVFRSVAMRDLLWRSLYGWIASPAPPRPSRSPVAEFDLPRPGHSMTSTRSFHDPARGIHVPGAGNRFAQRWPSIYLLAVFHRLHAGHALSPTRPSIYPARVIQRPHARLPWAAVWPFTSLALACHIPGRSLA